MERAKNKLLNRGKVSSERKEHFAQNSDRKKETSHAYLKCSYSVAPERKRALSRGKYSIAQRESGLSHVLSIQHCPREKVGCLTC